MRILADENVPGAVVATLRERGHDVLWVLTDAPHSPDPVVLELAQELDRLLITFDKDFGELAFKAGLPAAAGVVLVRADAVSPSGIARLVAEVINSRTDWAGHFSVIDKPQPSNDAAAIANRNAPPRGGASVSGVVPRT